MEEFGKYEYTEPKKGVSMPSDIKIWESSEAYQDILGFLMAMNDSIKGKKLSHDVHRSPNLINISKILERLNSWVDEIPPLEQAQRYGNKAFRDFYDRLTENSESLLKEHLPSEHHPAIVELRIYLCESFGNSTRIDYGTGHELSFVMFLCVLHKVGILRKEDSAATVALLFKSYLELSRKLQMTYKMEPAGSQGVWSLDDYQFVPFIWGSAQLVMHPKISPEMITSEKVVQEYHSDYFFLGCIKYIMEVKTGPFAEHSNQLWNISAVQSWSKVNQGLFKMYKAEILNKFPIIQHVLFGSVLTLNPAQSMTFSRPPEMGPLKGCVGSISRATVSGSVGPLRGVVGGITRPPVPGTTGPGCIGGMTRPHFPGTTGPSIECVGGVTRAPFSSTMAVTSGSTMPPPSNLKDSLPAPK